jgi:mRNA interferase RelE/StbE
VKVVFHPDVYKQLQQLPRPAFAAALETIVGLVGEPRPHGAVKLVGGANDRRIRIGQFRILYAIDEDGGLVTVMRVVKRSDAYR